MLRTPTAEIQATRSRRRPPLISTSRHTDLVACLGNPGQLAHDVTSVLPPLVGILGKTPLTRWSSNGGDEGCRVRMAGGARTQDALAVALAALSTSNALVPVVIS